jgi:RNA polymerase sigma-70 factor (ECF subfamily)
VNRFCYSFVDIGEGSVIRCRGVAANMQNKSEAELMKLVIDNQREALEELYRRYIRLVYSFALKATKDEGRARMIVQLVFTRLWTTEKGYDESKGNFINWLLTITRNCVIDEARREKKHQDQIQWSPERWEQLNDQDENTNPEAFILNKEKKERIQQAFQWLSKNQVQLLQLLYWEGYSLREIAALHKEPLGTIKSRLHQTLKILRKHWFATGRDKG